MGATVVTREDEAPDTAGRFAPPPQVKAKPARGRGAQEQRNTVPPPRESDVAGGQEDDDTARASIACVFSLFLIVGPRERLVSLCTIKLLFQSVNCFGMGVVVTAQERLLQGEHGTGGRRGPRGSGSWSRRWSRRRSQSWRWQGRFRSDSRGNEREPGRRAGCVCGRAAEAMSIRDWIYMQEGTNTCSSAYVSVSAHLVTFPKRVWSGACDGCAAGTLDTGPADPGLDPSTRHSKCGRKVPQTCHQKRQGRRGIARWLHPNLPVLLIAAGAVRLLAPWLPTRALFGW